MNVFVAGVWINSWRDEQVRTAYTEKKGEAAR